MDGALRDAMRYLTRGLGLEDLAEALPLEHAKRLRELLDGRIREDRSPHDHPPRPVCWACGSTLRDLHEPTCEALLSVALYCIDEEDDYGDLRDGLPTNRTYWGGVLDAGRRAGANMKRLRRDPDAVSKATRREREWP